MNLSQLFGRGKGVKPILLDPQSPSTDLYIELLHPDMCMSIEGCKDLAVALLRAAREAQEDVTGLIAEKADIAKQSVFLASRLYTLAGTDAVPILEDNKPVFAEAFRDEITDELHQTGYYYLDEGLTMPVKDTDLHWRCPYLEFPLLAELSLDDLMRQYEILQLMPEAFELSRPEQEMLKDKCLDQLHGLTMEVFKTLHPLTSMYATGLFTKHFVTSQDNVDELDYGRDHVFECDTTSESALFLRYFLEAMQRYYRRKGLHLRIFHYPQQSFRFQWSRVRRAVYDRFPKKRQAETPQRRLPEAGRIAERCLRLSGSSAEIYRRYCQDLSLSHDTEDDDDDDIEDNEIRFIGKPLRSPFRMERNEAPAQEQEAEEQSTSATPPQEQSSEEESRQQQRRVLERKFLGDMQCSQGMFTYQHVYDSVSFMVVMNTPPEANEKIKVRRHVVQSLDEEEKQKRTHKL